MDDGMPLDVLAKADKLADKLSVIEKSPAYVNATQAMVQLQKDNFEMIDQSLTMMQAVHKAELQNSDFYVDLLKFLIPLFATATITGVAIDNPGVNSIALSLIGEIGLALSVVFLVPILVQRHKKAKRQNSEYNKLSGAFTKWEKIADLQKQLQSDSDFSPKKVTRLLREITDIADMVDGVKK